MEGVVDEEGNRSPGGVGESLDTHRPRSLKSRRQEESLVWRWWANFSQSRPQCCSCRRPRPRHFLTHFTPWTGLSLLYSCTHTHTHKLVSNAAELLLLLLRPPFGSIISAETHAQRGGGQGRGVGVDGARFSHGNYWQRPTGNSTTLTSGKEMSPRGLWQPAWTNVVVVVVVQRDCWMVWHGSRRWHHWTMACNRTVNKRLSTKQRQRERISQLPRRFRRRFDIDSTTKSSVEGNGLCWAGLPFWHLRRRLRRTDSTRQPPPPLTHNNIRYVPLVAAILRATSTLANVSSCSSALQTLFFCFAFLSWPLPLRL